MFAYNKNFEQLEEEDSEDELDELNQKYQTFTFDYLFKKILELSEDQAASQIRQIVHWKMKSSENILRSLLQNN